MWQHFPPAAMQANPAGNGTGSTFYRMAAGSHAHRFF
jgi:hypothetical protein